MTGPSYHSASPIQDDHRKPRTHVLCFDGTANEFSHKNTNVVKLYSILKKDDPKSQLCYYQAGIGTYFQPGVVSPLFRYAARSLDEMFAWYLSEHIMDGYKFLMQNYHEGDSVCIFGFSRGAYTARALAGMLHKVGLLSKDNLEQVPFAYRLYKSSSRKDNKLAARFKRVFSREVPIEFIGVWDTVASVGIASGRTLPFVGSNDTVKWFRQALSLDERRAKFRPNLYHRQAADSSLESQTPKKLIKRAFTFPIQRDTPVDLDYKGKGLTNTSEYDTNPRVQEVWFAGCHSDVGGGHAKDSEKHALSNIPLRWMVQEILKTKSHILFDETELEQWKIPVAAIKQAPNHTRDTSDATLYTPQETSETPEAPEAPDSAPKKAGTEEAPTPPEPFDALDAKQSMGDQLRKNWFWWFLEIVPTKYTWQNERDVWDGGWSINRGRGRKLPSHPQPLFHESVRIRFNDPYLDYVPAARYERGNEKYVV